MRSSNFRLERRLTTQDRLRNLLTNSGFWITDELWRQRGAYTHNTWGLARWGGRGTYLGDPCEFYSWDTMTECVRQGIDWSVNKPFGGRLEIEISRKGE